MVPKRGARPRAGGRYHLDHPQSARVHPDGAAEARSCRGSPTAARRTTARSPSSRPASAGHDILIGYGRVGSLIGQALAKRGMKMLVIETSDDGVEKARQDGAEVLVGNAADPEILTAANVAGARAACS